MPATPGALTGLALVSGSELGQVRVSSLAEQVADRIVGGIAAGVLQPGQRIIEIEVARQLGVSRIPLREALKTLEIQGIIRSAPYRGAHVTEVEEARTRRVYEARVALERLAAHDASIRYRAVPEALKPLDQTIEQMEQAVRVGDWSAANQADISFHRAICAASGNDIVVTLWETLAHHIRIIFGREIRNEQDHSQLARRHRALRDALARGAADLDQAIEQHIMRRHRPTGTSPAKERS